MGTTSVYIDDDVERELRELLPCKRGVLKQAVNEALRDYIAKQKGKAGVDEDVKRELQRLLP